MKTLMEAGIPLKIIEKGNKYVVVLNFKKPIGKKMIKLISDLLDLMENNVSED